MTLNSDVPRPALYLSSLWTVMPLEFGGERVEVAGMGIQPTGQLAGRRVMKSAGSAWTWRTRSLGLVRTKTFTHIQKGDCYLVLGVKHVEKRATMC